MATKYEILKCDPTPTGGWIVRMKASDPSLSQDIFVEKETVLRLNIKAGRDPVETALAHLKAAGWKATLDRKLAGALSMAGILAAAPLGPKLEAPREVAL
jgi:hypothetical protein